MQTDKNNFHKTMINGIVNLLGVVSAVITIVAFPFQKGIITPRSPGESLNQFIHLTILIFITYGLIWHLTQTLYNWLYDTGARGVLPHGYSAMWLSLSLTIPVMVMPILYQLVTNKIVVTKGHLAASFAMIVVNILTNFILYGAYKYIGTVNFIVPLQEILNGLKTYSASRLLVMQALNEFINAFVNVGPTLLSYLVVYRLVIGRTPAIDGTMLIHVLAGCLITFIPIELYILIKYPDSLLDSIWINVRGIVASVSMSASYVYVLYCL
jgi:hypothetical protein